MIFNLQCRGTSVKRSYRDSKWRASFSVHRRVNLLREPLRKHFENAHKISAQMVEDKDISKHLFPTSKLLSQRKHKHLDDSPLKFLAGQDIINEYKTHIAQAENYQTRDNHFENSLKTSKTFSCCIKNDRQKLRGRVVNVKDLKDRVCSTMKHSLDQGTKFKPQTDIKDVNYSISFNSRLNRL